MEKQRYVVLDKNGKANIVQKADSRFVGIDEMAPLLALGSASPSYKFGITFALNFLLASISTPICTQKFCASISVCANMLLYFSG